MLISHRKVKRVFLPKREPLFVILTNMLLHDFPYATIMPVGEDKLLKEFQDVFLKDLLYGLPPLQGIEHHIDLILGATLPNRASYRTNLEKTKEIQKHVAKLIEKGWVRESMSPCGMPIILVPKNDGTCRICTDCKAINNITVRYRHLISHLNYLLDELHGSKVFSKIDLESRYHQIKTKFGLYEWYVMPFRLTNAPSTFMRLMNHRSVCSVPERLLSLVLLLAHMESRLMRKGEGHPGLTKA
ncbi:hypothetical protein CR513_43419, partial [Mucuna pruriens]